MVMSNNIENSISCLLIKMCVLLGACSTLSIYTHREYCQAGNEFNKAG